jgi:RimJ/RimL family protein N-acetyltransferase
MVFSPGRDLAVGIVAPDSSELIGMVLLYDKDLHHRHAGLEVLIADKHLPLPENGSQAALLMLNHAFVVLGLERVEARAREDYAPGRRILERAGFTLEACQRRALQRDGKATDVCLCSILRDEFLAMRPRWQWPYPPTT